MAKVSVSKKQVFIKGPGSREYEEDEQDRELARAWESPELKGLEVWLG